MLDWLKKRMQDESGITALETAIILIAFVVVAAVFAFTILSAGTVSTEKGKAAIFAGLEEVSSSLELRGSVLATGNEPGTAKTDPAGAVKKITFTVGNVAGGSALDLTDTKGAKPKAATPVPGNNKVVIVGYLVESRLGRATRRRRPPGRWRAGDHYHRSER